MCGWLKDKFNVSWQVSPTVLGEMLQDPDKKKMECVTETGSKGARKLPTSVAEMN